MANAEDGLPYEIRQLIADAGGAIDTRTAKQAGVTRSRLQRLSDDGLLTRLAPGIYAPASAAKLDDWKRFALRARAFAASCGPAAYLTGWGAAVHWDLPTLGRPPVVPTVIRPKAPGRGPSNSRSGRILVADVPTAHLGQQGGLRLVGMAWAVMEIARRSRLPHSLVVADRALRLGADLTGVGTQLARWKGAGRARWVAEHADPAAESPLETLGRFAFLEHDLPLPVANAWVGHDRPERRVDGLLPWHWCAFEGDGAMKYDNRDDASHIVRDQYEREFHLRRLGLDFARFGWPDVYPSRRPLADKARALLRDRPARSRPVRWWKHVPGKGPVEPQPADWPSPNPVGVILPAGWDRDR